MVVIIIITTVTTVSTVTTITRHPSPFYHHISIIILTVTILVVSMQLVLNFVVFLASVACLVGRKHKPWQEESTKSTDMLWKRSLRRVTMWLVPDAFPGEGVSG